MRECAERRMERLSNMKYHDLHDDFHGNISENIEVRLETEGEFNFNKIFDLLLSKH